jgi:hypothetical protein
VASTPWYPTPQPDGVPDAYRLHPSGTVIYRGFGDRWHAWDTKLPLRLPPSQEALEAATPLYLSGQAVTDSRPAGSESVTNSGRAT